MASPRSLADIAAYFGLGDEHQYRIAQLQAQQAQFDALSRQRQMAGGLLSGGLGAAQSSGPIFQDSGGALYRQRETQGRIGTELERVPKDFLITNSGKITISNPKAKWTGGSLRERLQAEIDEWLAPIRSRSIA